MDRIEELRHDIAANRVPGGSAFARAAAELIALSVERLSPKDPSAVRALVDELATWLTETKPSMAIVRNVADLARESAAPEALGSDIAASIVHAMLSFIERSERAIESLASHAAEVLPAGCRVLVHSFSASVLALLRAAASSGENFDVLFTESRPYRESRRLVEALIDFPVRLTLFSDAAVCVAASRANVALVGADAIFLDGSFANKTGSLPLALACERESVPLYVASELAKLYDGPADDVGMELRPASELAEGWELVESGRVEVWNQFFERVECRFVHRYVTEAGLVRPEELLDAARVRGL